MSLDFSGIVAQTEVVKGILGADYVLKEATGAIAVIYRNDCMRAAKLNDGKVSGIDGLADAEPKLISMCLFRSDGISPVSIPEIKGWPARIQKALYTRIREMSNLGEDDTEESLQKTIDDATKKLTELKEKKTKEEEAKNLRKSTEGGSV